MVSGLKVRFSYHFYTVAALLALVKATANLPCLGFTPSRDSGIPIAGPYVVCLPGRYSAGHERLLVLQQPA